MKRPLSAAVFLCVLLLLAGCGGTTDSGDAGSGDTRVVEHARGRATVPAQPERVVVLDRFPLDSALAVGVRPVGVPDPSNLPSYLAGRVGEAKSIGGEYAPSLERIAALKPDLIIGSVYSAEGNYGKLKELAPTVLIDDEDSGRWKEIHAEVSEALGEEKAGERVMVDYRDRTEELDRAMGEGPRPEVSVVRPREDGIRLYGKTYFSGTILEDAGLPRPPSQDFEEKEPLDISKELVRKADGDVIFVWSYDPDEREELEKVRADPLWNRLEAVRENRVYEVGDHWYGGGPLAADAVLDDLFEHLVKERN